jgi:high-affinity iron transporter
MKANPIRLIVVFAISASLAACAVPTVEPAAQDYPAKPVESVDEVEEALNAGTSPLAVISNTAMIVFREGLEAVIILAALLASMSRPEYRRFRRPLAAGAGLSLLATVLTWLLTQQILLSFVRLGERLEAIVSLIAVAVLLLITNWFFHRTYWSDWMASMHQVKGRLLNAEVGQAVGLLLLGFTSVYREGFETVLILQALVLDAGLLVVLQGVAIGLLAVTVVGVLTFSLQKRLPYMHMLVLTGILIGVVLITMVGHTIHVMQEVAWVPTVPIQSISLPYWLGQWFGVYPTWQTLGGQFAAAAFVIGSYYLAEGRKERQRKARAVKAKAQPQQAADAKRDTPRDASSEPVPHQAK